MKKEFSRILLLDTEEKKTLTFQASPQECQALAQRFSIPSIQTLTCKVTLEPERMPLLFLMTLFIEAAVIQTCSITLEEFPETLQSTFQVTLCPENHGHIHLINQDIYRDVETYSSSSFDIGEVIAQYLSLSLMSYPKRDFSNP